MSYVPKLKKKRDIRHLFFFVCSFELFLLNVLMSKYRQITISNTRVTEIHSICGIICDTHDGTFSPTAAKRGNAPTTVGKWQCQLPSPVGKKKEMRNR